MTAAVDARDLFRIHRSSEGEAAALQGLTLHVDAGEVVAVLGPSGSGKSTLLRILAGLERPSAGTARVLGHDMAELSPRAGGRVAGPVAGHRRPALPPLAAPRAALPRDRRAAARNARRGRAASATARAGELLERVGLADAAESAPGTLSGGEQQRVAICAALAHRPTLLLADEPAGELDAANVAVAYRLIADLARDHGATVVLVSHDPAATAVADRTVHIRDGRLSDEASGGGATAIVVGRGGWLRLPEELLRDAGVGRLARAQRHDQGILLTPAGPPRRPQGARRRRTRAGAAARGAPGGRVARRPDALRRGTRRPGGARRATTPRSRRGG